MKAIDFGRLYPAILVFAPIEDVGLQGDLILVQNDDCVNSLTPLLMWDADRGHILDLGMRAERLLHLGGIHILAAADNHITFAVGEKIEAIRIAPSQIADRTIFAAERRSVFSGDFQ